MAGSITVTTSEVAGAGGVRKYSIAWTSDAAGAVSSNTFSMAPGSIVMVEFIPSGGGTAPTDLYDVTFLDANSVNIFDNGAGTSIGADLSATVATTKMPFIGGGAVTYVRRWTQGGTFQPVVANAGNAKQGTINVYVGTGVL
jgi:hypothetical protein